jgi:hypothetical protein
MKTHMNLSVVQTCEIANKWKHKEMKMLIGENTHKWKYMQIKMQINENACKWKCM